MIVELAIPVVYKENVYSTCELSPPNTGTLADTKKIAENGDGFSAILTFLTNV